MNEYIFSFDRSLPVIIIALDLNIASIDVLLQKRENKQQKKEGDLLKCVMIKI